MAATDRPAAAASLEEGLEETLTVVRLGVPELLRKTLATTNPIEGAFSVAESVTRRVKRSRRQRHAPAVVRGRPAGCRKEIQPRKATSTCRSSSPRWIDSWHHQHLTLNANKRNNPFQESAIYFNYERDIFIDHGRRAKHLQ